MKAYKNLIGNFISLVVVQGSNYIIPLVTLPYLVSTIGLEEYGLISYSLAFMQYFIIFTGFGFNLYIPKYLAENRDDKKKVNEIFSATLLVKIILVSISILLMLFLVNTIEVLAIKKEIIYYTFGVVIAQALMPIWFFQGMEKMKWITLINFVSKLLYALGLFLLVKNESDTVNVPILNSVSQLIAAAIGLVLCYRQFGIKFKFLSYIQLIEYTKAALPFFLSRVSVSIYTSSNAFFLGTFGSIEMVGIYSIAEKLYQAVQGIYHPLVNALYPFISRAKDKVVFKKVFLIAIGLNLLFIFALYYVAPYLFDIVFNQYLPESITLFKFLILICIAVVPSILLGYPYLGAFGHTKHVNYSVMFSSIFHLGILFILALTDSISIMNIAYSLLITEVIVLIIRVQGVIKYKLI